MIAFHLTQTGLLSASQVPLLFAVAMATDAAVALGVGRLYDRNGLVILIGVPIATIAALLVFTTSTILVWTGAILWGAILGIQESTLRAAVADLAQSASRATAYGIFNAVYGSALLVGGTTLGLLYEWSAFGVVVFVAICEALAFLLFARTVGGRSRTLRS